VGPKQDLGIAIGRMLEEHLAEQEASRRAVSRMATGAAFEGWLAFETRLQMEVHRDRLHLNGDHQDSHGHEIDRYWIGNEYNKVDLGVLDYDADIDNWVLALEFKLITNNKNWRKKCDDVWADLDPKRHSKKGKIKPRLGRFAMVAMMGKVFREAGPYSWRKDIKAWEGELWEYMLPTSGPEKGKVHQVWKSRRFELQDRWLSAESNAHFLELHLLART
jgi:hypothetical protein